MEEFPSGQRGQTVNLLLLASVVRMPLLHQKKDFCILQSPFFNEINPSVCEIALRAVKYTASPNHPWFCAITPTNACGT